MLTMVNDLLLSAVHFAGKESGCPESDVHSKVPESHRYCGMTQGFVSFVLVPYFVEQQAVGRWAATCVAI